MAKAPSLASLMYKPRETYIEFPAMVATNVAKEKVGLHAQLEAGAKRRAELLKRIHGGPKS